MAIDPSAAKKALETLDSLLQCRICAERFNTPKVLDCSHIVCEPCLHRITGTNTSLMCPYCRKDTILPVGGILELQKASFIDHFYDVHEALNKVTTMSHQLKCNRCKRQDEAVSFCNNCKFVCERCEEAHSSFSEYIGGHEIVQLNSLIGSLNGEFGNVSIDSIITQVQEQVKALVSAVKAVDSQSNAITEQTETLAGEIRTHIEQLRQTIDERETELVSRAEQMKVEKLGSLENQREMFGLQIAQLRFYRDFLESQRTSNPEQLLIPIIKKVNNVTGSFTPKTLALAEQADMVFAHSLPELAKTCQQFGKVYCHPVCPEKCRASGEGIKVATRGQTMAVSVEAFDREVEAYLRPVDSLRCELAASDGSSRVRGTVKRRNQNIYDICYQPQVTGEHQLHILIEGHPIFDSPFTVTVLPDFTAPVDVIGDLKGPWGIAVREGGEVVVAERDGGCVSIISNCREKTCLGYLKSPTGVAIDLNDNILVVDSEKHCIHQFSKAGEYNVGSGGNGYLQFQSPKGIAIHPLTNRIYVADSENHRIQILEPSLDHHYTFGSEGLQSEQFDLPYDVAIDRKGHVYVADRRNDRIQVFSANHEFLREFDGGNILTEPLSITVDSNNILYVCEFQKYNRSRVLVFSTEGEFLQSFHCQNCGAYAVTVDKNGRVHLCSAVGNSIEIFQ